MMLLRDLERLADCRKRMNVSPIGCCALAGTTYNTDRRFEAWKLGFHDVARNSIDGVSDRDFCLELMSCISVLMMHLSRFSEEIILWASWEFKFIELSDAYTTGSSIMPQKKNPDMAELVRGKTGRVYGDLMAYAMMLLRDLDRLADCRERMNVSPIGCCALAGTTYNTDRRFEAWKLGFDDVARNSIDGVSDRDFCLELMSSLSILMMHLSRFSEEIILWASWEFKFIELSDAYTTGSSIMPQKKNPDMAELVRGKTGRVYGDLMALLTTLKGLPLAYNKDMQEDKEAVFDAVDTVKMCLKVFAPMLATMTAKPENMKKAAQGGFINATDLADYLAKKGLPFRSAYKISGRIVAQCISEGLVLETLPLSEYQKYSDLFEEDLYRDIDLLTCVEKRISEGGTSVASVEAQIAYVKENLA